jgi:hypothetical protein
VNARGIAKELFEMRDLTDGNRTLSIDPASGFLFYADYDQLWRNPRGVDLPVDKSEIEKLARGFIEDANRRVFGNRALRLGGVQYLFPNDIRPIWIGGVMPKSGTTPDHCLCQFGVFVAADVSRTARVEGAAIDIRIGRRRQVIGVSSRWRILSGDILSEEMISENTHDALLAESPMKIRIPERMASPTPNAPALPIAPIPPEKPRLDATHQERATHFAAAERTELLYWLAAGNVPQTYVSPVHLVQDGHHGHILPASLHSFHIEILHRSEAEGMLVTAAVTGGSGKFEYEWGCWTPVHFFEGGVRSIGTSASARLERGIFNVLLHVRDTVTGAVACTERTIVCT